MRFLSSENLTKITHIEALKLTHQIHWSWKKTNDVYKHETFTYVAKLLVGEQEEAKR
jgi:hypothetical protein